MTAPDATFGNSVRKSVTVNADRARAFEVFTTRIGAWWPRFNSIGQSALADVVLEPREGGRWYERGEDGVECEWGKVILWDPPGRLVLAWQINGRWAYDEKLVTEVELRFSEVDTARTRVDLEHRNLERYGPARKGMQSAFDSPNGWGGILQRYANLAETESPEASSEA